MRGLSDDEMAAMFGISPHLIESWKEFYPTFAKAIEEGRTAADAKVVQALYDNAVGFEHESDEVVKTRTGAHVVTVRKFYRGDTAAQKFWLENRSQHWRQQRNSRVAVGGDPALPGIKVETKMEVINSILSMIAPRPDNAE